MNAAVGSLLRKRRVEDGCGFILDVFPFKFVVLVEILVVAMAWVGGRSTAPAERRRRRRRLAAAALLVGRRQRCSSSWVGLVCCGNREVGKRMV